MKVLVINCGSSSVKYQLIETRTEECLARGLAERISLENSVLTHVPAGNEHYVLREPLKNHQVAVSRVIEVLSHPVHGVIGELGEVDGIGHRFVNGGARFPHPVRLTDEIIVELDQLADLAPLHNPNNLLGIRACLKLMPATPQIIVFDTAFHIRGMPEYAYLYGIPYSYYEHQAIRRYGFHGTSHHYVSDRAAAFLRKPLTELRLITCHLGNGSSLAAVKQGKSIETSMGFTPLEGLIMGTRSGDIDPAVVLKIMEVEGLSPQEMLNLLNNQSGLLGISGISPDMREILAWSRKKNQRAKLAFDMFCYRIRKTIGSYAAILGGTDAIVFTAGIGENSPEVRESCLENLEFLGVEIDPELNADISLTGERYISTKRSNCRVLVIPTNEELMIARETETVLSA